MIEMRLETKDGGLVNIQSSATGNTDVLLRELACGSADLIIQMAGALPQVDGLTESMAVLLHSYVLDVIESRMQGSDAPDA